MTPRRRHDVPLRYQGARAWHCAIADSVRGGDHDAVTRLSHAMRAQLASRVT